jgi:hypothetical protein
MFRPSYPHYRAVIAATILMLAVAASSAFAQRTPDGHPDLQGTWDNSTATPLTRPAGFSDKPRFTREEADEFERNNMSRILSVFSKDDLLASDLNDTYVETSSLKVVDDLRTSLIVDPPNGMLPPSLPQAKSRADARPVRNFDDPETLTLDERCLLGTAYGGSSGAPPLVPSPFGQNLYQIVQTPDHVLIFTEVIHDARIIRINGTHRAAALRSWLGDSIGHWEGDTLVVDTTNFRPETHFRGSSANLHVVERFTRTAAGTLRYRVTVEDPDTWTVPWTAEVPFKATTNTIFEYACHEGDRAIENFMRGARDEERRGVTPGR